MQPQKDRLLHALRLNAVFSTISAILMFAGAGWIASQLGLPGAVPVYVVAAGLSLFAAQLWHIVRTGRIQKAEVVGIIGGDFAWVITTAILVGLFYDSMTTTGLVLVDLVALIVLGLAVMQLRALRKLRSHI